MQIVVNGQTRSAAAPLALPALIDELRLGDRRVAVELNGAIVPRSQHETRLLEPGDRIEIVHALGGG